MNNSEPAIQQRELLSIWPPQSIVPKTYLAYWRCASNDLIRETIARETIARCNTLSLIAAIHADNEKTILEMRSTAAWMPYEIRRVVIAEALLTVHAAQNEIENNAD